MDVYDQGEVYRRDPDDWPSTTDEWCSGDKPTTPPSPNLTNPLTFEYGGLAYKLTFSRWTMPGHTKPFTTVTLSFWKEDGWQVFRTSTVGCYHKDQFSREEGRRVALRSLLIKDKALKAAIWDCYLHRHA